MNKHRLYFYLLFAVFFAGSCSGTKQPVIPPDIPERTRPSFMEYFERGKTAYKSGNIEDAVRLLKNSLEINPDYAPAAEFLGLSYLEKGDIDTAGDTFSKVLMLNAYSTRARMGIGRVYMARKNYEKALEAFDLVIQLDDHHAEAHFYRGVALNEMEYSFISKTSFIRAIMCDESYRPTISGMIPIESPDIGKLFKKEYLAIERSEKITRAQLAAVLVTIIQNNSVLSRNVTGARFTPPQLTEGKLQVADTAGNMWARSEIETAVKAGLMELYPDNTFRPESNVAKADFAGILQMIIARLYQDQNIVTRYIGQKSPYVDVNSAHWAYNAIRLTVDFNLLEPVDGTVFGISDFVSGESAIIALEKAAMLNEQK